MLDADTREDMCAVMWMVLSAHLATKMHKAAWRKQWQSHASRHYVMQILFKKCSLLISVLECWQSCVFRAFGPIHSRWVDWYCRQNYNWIHNFCGQENIFIDMELKAYLQHILNVNFSQARNTMNPKYSYSRDLEIFVELICGATTINSSFINICNISRPIPLMRCRADQNLPLIGTKGKKQNKDHGKQGQ